MTAPSRPRAALRRSAWMVTVVHEVKLSAVLAEFARTLTTDFPIQRILDHLVERIVEVLPVSAAGVTLISPGKAPRYIAASDAIALRFERLQVELGQGPCVLAYETGEPVTIADLRTDDRFPAFAAAGVEANMVGVFALPLRHGDEQLGALDLYRDTPGALDPDDMAAAQTLADVTAAYLLNARARDEARATSELFRDRAQHDHLTGLPNRLLLQQHLDHAVARSQRKPSNIAVLFVDLNDFKRVNDTHGHLVGDEMLVEVSRRLSELVRNGDILSRFSGDEFVFLCEDVHSINDARLLAARVDTAFDAPFELQGASIPMTASVGMAFAGLNEDVTPDLVLNADMAMYQAKRRGRGGHQLFDLRDGVLVGDRRTLEDDLRAALRADELDVTYQPIVRTTDGSITGAEALLRWTHPEQGHVAATSAVAVAEQGGFITELGAWVLERGCRDWQQWQHTRPAGPLQLAVNVSVQQLMTPDFCATVASVLDRTAMDPRALILEITESTFIEDSTRATRVLNDLKALKVQLALDDFGTGFSSLVYLRRLPIDIVKIDQCFVTDLGDAPSGAAIVEAITTLAHALGLTVTAEGVETARQRDGITAIGCDHAQGNFYAAPLCAEAFAAALGSNQEIATLPLGRQRREVDLGTRVVVP